MCFWIHPSPKSHALCALQRWLSIQFNQHHLRIMQSRICKSSTRNMQKMPSRQSRFQTKHVVMHRLLARIVFFTRSHDLLVNACRIHQRTAQIIQLYRLSAGNLCICLQHERLLSMRTWIHLWFGQKRLPSMRTWHLCCSCWVNKV